MTPILTLTGVDARTSVSWMFDLADKSVRHSGRPGLEFAILRSAKEDQSPRYPNKEVIRKITSAMYPGYLAFHLCGRYARMVHSLEWEELCNTIDFSCVGRVQVNSTECDERAILNLQRFSIHIDRPVIMQWRMDVFPCVPGLHLLQDRSGGRGVTESIWAGPDDLCQKSSTAIGYAGGLGPDNIKDAIPAIRQAASFKQFWIDCESSLRTDDWFDQRKAEAMVDAVREALPERFRVSDAD